MPIGNAVLREAADANRTICRRQISLKKEQPLFDLIYSILLRAALAKSIYVNKLLYLVALLSCFT